MKNKLKNKTLGLFLTEKMSLTNWDKAGILKREIAPYNLLAKHFYQIYIFTYEGKKELNYQKYLTPNIKIVYKRWRMRAKDYRWLLPFLNYRLIKRCDFLKTNQFKSRAALIAKIIHPQAKLILRTGWLPSRFYQQRTGKENKKLLWWEKIAYSLADIAVVTSQCDRNYLIQRNYLAPEKIKLIPNYIETEKFMPNEQQNKYKNRVLFVGRIDPQKNLETLIKALSQTNLTLDIVGPESIKTSGPGYKQKLINLATNLKVKLNFLGPVENHNLPFLLNKYKIFVLPSHYEGMPKSLLEAMSCGLACVGNKTTGIKELIIDNQTGLLFSNGSDELRKIVLKIINNNELIKQLSQRARQFVIDNYSLKQQLKKEIEIYENLV